MVSLVAKEHRNYAGTRETHSFDTTFMNIHTNPQFLRNLSNMFGSPESKAKEDLLSGSLDSGKWVRYRYESSEVVVLVAP